MSRPSDIDEALERGYNVRAARHDYDELLSDWMSRSEVSTSRENVELDVRYGPAERQRLDIFVSDPGGPTLVYLHGGYWQRGDKSAYSFLADPYNERGINVVVMGYTLCPAITLPGITEEIREGLVWLYRHGAEHGLSPDRINVSGHSAGGHLTAMMLATDWGERQCPDDLVKSGIPISGIYDLDPLRHTSINQAVGIDERTAREYSPLFLARGRRAVLTVVGGEETRAFHEQAQGFARVWSEAGIPVQHHVEPGVDHFDVVNRFADPQSELFNKTLDWLV